MPAQEHLIARVRELCLADRRLVAALTYGSFVTGEADAFSDIEFWLFADPAATPSLDERAWLARIGEIRHVVVNEFGSHVVFFPGLVRGEFHFATADDIEAVRTWPARGGATEHMIVLDRSGALRAALDSLPGQAGPPATAAEVEELCGRYANWLVLTLQVARRGEFLRAVDALSHVQRHLLWMARLAEGRTQHWLTPSRGAERDLPAGVVDAVRETTATAGRRSLDAAVTASWVHGQRYWRHLAGRAGFPVPEALFSELDAAIPPRGPRPGDLDRRRLA